MRDNYYLIISALSIISGASRIWAVYIFRGMILSHFSFREDERAKKKGYEIRECVGG